MKTNKVIEMLKSGNTAIPNFWFSEYKNIGLTEEEFLFLIGLIHKGIKFKNNSESIAKFFNMKPQKVLTIIASLEDKKIIKNDVQKNNMNKLVEMIDLTPFYEKMSMTVLEKKEEDNTSSIFSKFEKEFGRTLSPIEYEIINKWLEDEMNEEVILEALREAIYNGAHSLRYIDRILYEWRKKGIKNKSDIDKGYKKVKEENLEKTQIFDYNWLEDADKK